MNNTITNADALLFRASSNGYLMTEPREKNPKDKYEEEIISLKEKREKYALTANKETKTAMSLLSSIQKLEISIQELTKVKDEPFLSETTMTHLVDKFVSARYGRNTDIANKYTKKGLMVEEDSITLYSRVKKEFFKKNESTLSNEFICGTPDLFTGDDINNAETIIDVKSSWDIFTFFRTTRAKLNKQYYWQLQSYMALTGAKSAKLVYCLIDTPQPLIYDEVKRLQWKMGVIDPDTDELFQQGEKELEHSLVYSDIDINERYNEILIERNDEDIEALYNRIKECRVWMNRNLFNHKQ